MIVYHGISLATAAVSDVFAFRIQNTNGMD